MPPPLACSASPHSPPPFPRICGAPWLLHAAPQQTLTPLASGCRRTVNNHCSGCYPSTTTASSSPISIPSSNLGGVLLLLPLGFGHGLLHHGVVVGCTLSICPAYSTVVTHQSCCRSAAAPDDHPHRSNAFPYSPASPARRQARHLTARQGSWRTCRTWRWWTGASDTCSGWTKGLFRWTI